MKRRPDHPPGAHLGAYPSTVTMTCKCRRSRKKFSRSSRTFPRSASRSICTKRSLMCQCLTSRSRSASRSACTNRSSICQCPSLNLETKHVEVPQTPYLDKIAVMPVGMQRQAPRPSIDQVTRHAEFPQNLYIDKSVDLRVVLRRQVPRIQTANKPSINQGTKHAVFSQIQYIDKVIVDMRVVLRRQVPCIQTVWKIVEAPPAKFVGTVVDVPVIDQVSKRVEILQTKYTDTEAAVPVVIQRQVPQMQMVFEDSESPAGAVHRQSGHACDQAVEIIPQKRIPERVGQIDDVPVPQILVNEPQRGRRSVFQRGSVNRSLTPPFPTSLRSERDRRGGEGAKMERISEKIGEQIDDDIVPVDQPGDQARCDTQACGDAEKGPSDSDCLEDSGTPSDSESDLAESSDEGSAEEAKRPRLWSRRHWGRRQGPRDGWSWARNSWSWRW